MMITEINTMVTLEIEKWVENNMAVNKKADRQVLEFIANILFSEGIDGYETIKNLFSDRYCYYFSLMLRDAFGGKICWVKGTSHIVWMSPNGVPYNASGVFFEVFTTDMEHITDIKYLGSSLEGFRHRGRDTEVSDEMEEYCKNNNISMSKLEENIFALIPDEEKLYPTPNYGDAIRYWGVYKEME